MSDSGEEKSLPATEKKLNDARKKGQISKSTDLVTGISTVALLGFLLFGAGSVTATFSDLVKLAVAHPVEPAGQFDQQLDLLIKQLLMASAGVLLPPIGISLASILLSSVWANRGIIFSLEPIKPKLENVGFFSGLKRIFGPRSFAELAKSVVKTILLAAAVTALVMGSLDALLRVPVCGLSCLPDVLEAFAKPLLAAAAILFLLVGLADIQIQQRLFMHEMRMTQTEMKREQKDQSGDPLIRGQLQNLRQENAEAGPRPSVDLATVVVEGPGAIIGLRYVRGETPVPVLVFRARAQRVGSLAQEARKLGKPIVVDADLAQGLSRGLQVGGYVPEKHFTRVARAVQMSQNST